MAQGSDGEESLPWKKRKVDLQEIVRVVVGEQKTEFTLHKDLLITRCSFFRAAFTGNWEEAKSGTITLTPDGELGDDVKAFEKFAHWLYFGKTWFEVSKSEIAGENIVENLLELWILGDRLACPLFKNEVMERLVPAVVAEDLPSHAWVNRVYQKTPPGSMLRKLLADTHAWFMGTTGDHLNKIIIETNDDFVVDMVRCTMSEWHEGVANEAWEEYFYHEYYFEPLSADDHPEGHSNITKT